MLHTKLDGRDLSGNVHIDKGSWSCPSV